MRVLLVEASKTQQLFFANILTEMGAEVTLALTGENALEHAGIDHPFDLICISVVLPDMKGAQLCTELRAQHSSHSTPLIMLSSGATDSGAECMKAGATDIFYKNDLKPFTEYVSKFLAAKRENDFESGRILYVEDSKSLATVVMQLLTRKGYAVNLFDNAEDAYKAYQKRPYDLLITDVVLKGRMTGLSLVRAIREEKGDKQLPILVMSEFGDATRTIELYRAGANDYVSKPPLHDELLARVSNLIKSKQLFDQIQRRNAELSQLAIIDELTGLYNRRFLREMVEKKINAALADQSPLCVAVLDIDHFKSINDTYGHSVGDQILKHVAKAITSESNQGAITARVGGEEFVLLMENTDEEIAQQQCERIRKTIEELRPLGLDTSISIGIAKLTGVEEFNQVFKRADDALYQAKKQGRNRVCMESPKTAENA